jgi:hypothetical protein
VVVILEILFGFKGVATPRRAIHFAATDFNPLESDFT